MPKYQSFRDWIKRQQNREDPVGDLGKQVVEWERLSDESGEDQYDLPSNGLRYWVEYLVRHGGNTWMDAIERAWYDYQLLLHGDEHIEHLLDLAEEKGFWVGNNADGLWAAWDRKEPLIAKSKLSVAEVTAWIHRTAAERSSNVSA